MPRERRTRAARWSLLLLIGTLLACPTRRDVGDDDDVVDDDDDSAVVVDDDDTTEPECAPDGSTSCLDDVFRVCEDSRWQDQELCEDLTPLCSDELGCISCWPGIESCEGDAVVVCDEDGLGTTVVQTCDDTEECTGAECISLCDLAASTWSYLGCDFLAVTNPNNVLPAQFADDFGLVIGTPADHPAAHVSVSRGGTVLANRTIAPGTATQVELPMVPELQAPTASDLLADGAYEVHSDVPVTAYQFDPLHYEIGGTPSWTNDASLLLPEHALGQTFRLAAWPTAGLGGFIPGPYWSLWGPGFVTVAAASDNTEVTVTVSSETMPGDPGPLAAGESVTLTLDRGDVLGIGGAFPGPQSDTGYCADQGWQAAFSDYGYCLVPGWDLTGSLVTSTAPVAVFAGHVCAYVPFDSFACDHLEEMMLPVETWGDHVVMTAPVHPEGATLAEALYRVVAHHEGTSLTFEPSVADPVTLAPGEHVEFRTGEDFVIEGTAPFLAVQYLLGQQALATPDGDPAMGTGIPTSQMRDAYHLLAPDTFVSHYLNLVAPAGAAIELDGVAVSGWAAIGASGYEVVRVPVTAGAHGVVSTDGSVFSVTSYGYAPWTSYLLPGGLHLGR